MGKTILRVSNADYGVLDTLSLPVAVKVVRGPQYPDIEWVLF
jgi:hypothetical protein